VRALSVHTDVIVLISSIWQTTATAVRSAGGGASGGPGFLIDSPVLPAELAAVPDALEQAGFPVSGLLATHADWDHLLGRLAFPDAALGLAESSAARVASEPGAAQHELRRFDEEHYIERAAPLTLGAIQELPVPGRLELDTGRELELYPAGGHTVDGMAISIPWAGVLVCGDYLSPVEAPLVSPGGSREAYLATLERLRGLVQEARAVVPGHGHPLDREAAMRILDDHVAQLLAG
jgi:glyoxylase-like metal-dependent hydrolase (beta-lactamase superfamily II)